MAVQASAPTAAKNSLPAVSSVPIPINLTDQQRQILKDLLDRSKSTVTEKDNPFTAKINGKLMSRTVKPFTICDSRRTKILRGLFILGNELLLAGSKYPTKIRPFLRFEGEIDMADTLVKVSIDGRFDASGRKLLLNRLDLMHSYAFFGVGDHANKSGIVWIDETEFYEWYSEHPSKNI